MKLSTFHPVITTLLVVFVILSVSLLQPVHGEKIANRYIQELLRSRSPLNRSYSKTSDGGEIPIRPKYKCRMWKNCYQFEDETKRGHQWECVFDEHGIEGISNKVIAGIDNDWLEIIGAESGKSMLVLSDAEILRDRVVVDKEKVMRIEPYDDTDISVRRRLAYPSDGILNTLVVRVNALDNSPPPSESISENIFQDDWCLKSQYGNCSHNKLQVKEYVMGDQADIPTTALGVIDITVQANAEGGDSADIQDLANSELRKLLGTSDILAFFDAVMFCLPPGLSRRGDEFWLGYAYIGRWDSYYNNEWCLKLSAQMHEVGHNLGLEHSGEYVGSDSEIEYGDWTCMMGSSFFEDDTPKMCFNPAKNWQLGWYEDKALDVLDDIDFVSSGSKSFVLNGVVDYDDDSSTDAYIVLKIDEFYIGYNRAKSFNEDVIEARFAVTIVERIVGNNKSKLAAKLYPGDTFTINNGFAEYEVTYTSNSSNNINVPRGKDAIVDIHFVGELETCQGEFDASVEVELRTDRHPTETSWGIVNKVGAYIQYYPPFSYNSKNTLFTETVTNLCRGIEYYFVIEDSFGDGLKRLGRYSVSFEGSILVSGKDFEFQDVQAFTLPLEDAPSDCVDDPDFEFRGKEGINCTFLAGLQEQKTILICGKRANKDTSDPTKVYEYCRGTCDGVGITEACPS